MVLMSTGLIMSSAGATSRYNDRSVRVWGDISSTYRDREYDGGDSHASEWLNMSSISASSYIWQPWFATAMGNLAFSVDETEVSGQEPVQDQYISGRFQLNLFPTSRFPFTAYTSHSRNELDDVIFSRDVTNTELGFIQQYRSVDGRHHYRANYERNLRDDEINNYITDTWVLSSSNQFKNQVIYGDIQYDKVENEIQTDKAVSYSVTGRQTYNKVNNLTLENLVSTSAVDNEFLSTETRSETAQFSSLLSWRPGNRDNLNITGSFRVSELLLENIPDTQNPSAGDVNEHEISTLNINQGLIYNYSRNIIINESINGSYNKNDGETQFTGSESIGINYSPDTIKLLIGNYSWSVGGTINNTHGDVENEKSLNSRISHSLSDSYILSKSAVLNTDITQSLNYDYRTISEDSETLNHSFSVTWNNSTITNQSFIRFLASDTRILDTEENSFQLFNLQFTGQFRINRYTRVTGNLTLQKSIQNSGQEQTDSEVINGQMDFYRNRLFQIPRLNFKSELKFSRQQSESERFISELTTNEPDSEVEWKNSLDYMIGRFEAKLGLDYIKSDDEFDRLIKIQIKRSFGDL